MSCTKVILGLVGILPVLTLPVAQAATSSGCYVVVNVAQGDALNVRAGPSGSDQIVDRLVPGRHGVLSRTGRCVPQRLPASSRWCPLTHYSGDGTRTGWAKARYLKSSGCP